MNTIDIPEMAEVLKCSEQRVLTGLASGEFPGVKIGKAWVIHRSAFFDTLYELARGNCVRADPSTGTPAVGRRRKSLLFPS